MRKGLAILFAAGVLGAAPGAALATPSFGPGAGQGQGNNGPQDNGAKCHPPGQTNDRPECK